MKTTILGSEVYRLIADIYSTAEIVGSLSEDINARLRTEVFTPLNSRTAGGRRRFPSYLNGYAAGVSYAFSQAIWSEKVDIERRYHCAPGLRELKRQALNHCGEFSGVEYLGFNRRIGEQVYYLNSGDSYATTLIFQGDRMSLGNWGYMVERGDIIGNQQ